MSKQAQHKPFEVLSKVCITDERVADMLVGAFEGGSNYWIDTIETVTAATGFGSSDRRRADYYPRVISTPLSGGAIKVKPFDDVAHVLDRAAIQRGLECMAKSYQKHWVDLVNETDDATTADVFLQLSLLGELVYG